MTILACGDPRNELAEGDRAAVEAVLGRFLDRRDPELSQFDVPVFARMLREFLAGGKRLRPLLCCCGWRAASGTGPLPDQVAGVAASLELFHAFALIHDDVMDNSTTRRGWPTAHRAFATLHARHPCPDQLGANAAILLGTLALGWSYDLLHAAGPPGAVWRLLETMRTETLTGQYLDLTTTATGGVERALRVCRYKTAAYTTQRPLQTGALLASAAPATVDLLGEVGLLLGEAFQLRDDLLGVFGSPEQTGKPVLDDLREGKNTVLLALARHHATPSQRAVLDHLVGNPALDEDRAAPVRHILLATGARDRVEAMIGDRCQRAEAILDRAGLRPAGTTMLRQLFTHAAYRDH